MTTSTDIKSLLTLFDENREEIINDYFSFLRIQSISSEPDYISEVLKGADFVKSYLTKNGFEIEQWETPHNPVIFASWLGAGKDAPTVLFYGHYDVQPIDPIELWHSPPFEPTVRDGQVYARGAQDDKGQIFYTIAALSYLLKRDGKLPLNVKICIEGDEEVGSPGLNSIVREKSDKLLADYLLIVDVGMHSPDGPSVTVGIRGLICLSIELTGSNTDLHSGSHGGVVYNPNHALVQLLAKLRDEKTGKVLVPNFYDAVSKIGDKLSKEISFDFDLDTYEKSFATKAVGGEKDFSPVESAWLRPTLEINGVGGGYAGPGFKTVIPGKSTAKISCRLVPNQDPLTIGESVKKFLIDNCPDGVSIKVDIKPGFGPGVWTDPTSSLVNACCQAFTEVLDRPCKKILEGATIPICVALSQSSKADLALIGYALPTDNIHAPNEHFGLDRMRNGFATIGRIVQLLAKK